MRQNDFSTLVKEALPDCVQNLLIKVGEISQRKRVQVYLVGGFVRDLLMGARNLDIDLVVQGDGLRFAQELANQLEARADVYKRFLTATLTLSEGYRIDVATARAEKYAEPASLPEVKPARIEDDLRRRDFTINSLALRVRKGGVGELRDPSGGLEDIRNGVIRVLHDASFVDDPTRIFRAIRYQVRFGFRLDGLTLKLLRKAVSDEMIGRLSGERIRNELWLLFEEERAASALGALHRLGVLLHIHPSLTFSPEIRRTLTELQKLARRLRGKLSVDLHLASLFSLLQKAEFDRAVEIGKRLALTRRQLEKITQMKLSIAKVAELSAESLKPSQVVSILRDHSSEFLLLAMARTQDRVVRERISRFLDFYRKVKPQIRGKDLKSMGIEDGPAYQKILSKVLDAKLDGIVATREDEIRLAKELWERRPG